MAGGHVSSERRQRDGDVSAVGGIDTGRKLEIAGSPWKMLKLSAIGIVMTGGCVFLAHPLLTGHVGHLVEGIVGLVGTIFFGACTLIAMWRGWTSTGSVVTLTPTGISDRRLARREIPWSAVQGLSTWSMNGQDIMVIAVAPDVEARLGLSAIARWTRNANRSLGADGLCVGSQELAIDHDQLVATTLAYAQAHGAPFTGPV